MNPFQNRTKTGIPVYHNKALKVIVECSMTPELEKKLNQIGNISTSLPMIDSYIMCVCPENLEKLEAMKEIRSIHACPLLSARMEQSRKMIHANEAADMGYTGEGIGIAILDTGISPMMDFVQPQNRIAVFRDFINGRRLTYDDNGHGTHVAGILAGNGALSYGKYCGIAPKSHIIALKILDENGQGNSAQALAAIQWVLDHRKQYNIRIINLSVGTNDHNVNIPLLRAVNAAWDYGIVVVSAAGNKDPQTGTNGAPGLSQKIITVGLYNDPPVRFTPYWPTPFFYIHRQWTDVLAPGKDIISCLSPDYSYRGRTQIQIVENNYVKMSGTSMATPMVSGAVALLLEKYPFLTPEEVKYRIRQTSRKRQGPNSAIGLLDIETLLRD